MVERFEISKGLSIPIDGEPESKVDVKTVSQVGLVAEDYPGLRPTMLVSEGDQVKLGQPVMLDKQNEGLVFTAPAGGRVSAIHRGAKRRFLALVIDVADSESKHDFARYDGSQVAKLSRELVAEQIAQAGLWTAFRTRPFSKVAPLKTAPQAIFVTAIDTNPLAVQPGSVIRESREDFAIGLAAIGRLTDGQVYVCRAVGEETPGEGIDKVRIAEFAGPHPAGLVGTHMHFLKPAGPGHVNWHLNYQDVIAIGRLFAGGYVDPTRIISLAGPVVEKPRYLKSRLGASLSQLTSGELHSGDNRIVSGSVLCGRQLQEPAGFLGRYHLQVSCLAEGRQRELLGWQMPGLEKYSITKAFASAWRAPKKFSLTTSTEGSERAMVPIGTYEKVVPLDILPTLLLRALIVKDTVRAQELGCLELDPEDLSLCTFVCPGKYEYGEILRDNLLLIEKEG